MAGLRGLGSTRTRRGSMRGTGATAMSGSFRLGLGFFSETIRLSDLFVMRGKGWDGSIARGVSTGYTSRRK